MRTLALGDVHGCRRSLELVAAAAKLRPDDLLVALGDYVSRGPDSRGVVDWLLEREETGRLVALRGNHEIMFLDALGDRTALRQYCAVGGVETLTSYGTVRDVPAEHLQFFHRTRPYFEAETHFFVHANAYADWPLDHQPDDVLYWQSFGDPPPHENGKVMVCGHSYMRGGRPKDVGHAVCIDTGSGFPGGWLTLLDVGSGRYWQANEAGEVRDGWLERE